MDTAFYIGVVISITLYLQKASSPQLRQYHVADSGRLRMVGHDESCGRQSVRVINAEGEFFFGAADLFQTTLKEIAEDDRHAKVIVLRLKNARDFDATTCLALRQLHDYLVESGRALILAGVQPHVLEVLKNAGLYDEVGAENVFPYDDRRPGRSMRRSLARAQELAGEPSDEREVAEPLLGSRRISVGGEGVDIAAGMLAGR